MSEFEQRILDRVAKLDVAPTPEQIKAYADRLDTFRKVFAENWQNFRKSTSRSWHTDEDLFNLESKGLQVADEKWDRLLGCVRPPELANNGVNSTFLVAWNHGMPSHTRDKDYPVRFWLARGKEVVGDDIQKGLIVDYVHLGFLKQETAEFYQDQKNTEESGSSIIYLDSPVILTAQAPQTP